MTSSSLVINYHKDSSFHHLNSVKEEIEAEAAEEMSGNFHSLDYLGLSGGGSLSSSVMSSMSLDEVANSNNACVECFGTSLCKYHKMQDSTYCQHHFQMYKDSSGMYGICDKNLSLSKVKHVCLSNSSGKSSPASCGSSPNYFKSNTLNSHGKEDSTTCRQASCKASSLGPCQKNLIKNSKVNSDKKNPVWHNPSKSDKLLSTSAKKDSSIGKKYGFCQTKLEMKENSYIDSKFSSLPRKKKEKNEKDIAAETYGTLGRNHKKVDKSTSETFNCKQLCTEKHTQDLMHDSKNTLDKYATLPRKKAKEVNNKWRELSNQKEINPSLHHSKPLGKGEPSRSTRGTPSPSFTTTSSLSSSPRNPSTFHKEIQNTRSANKIMSPSLKLIAKQNSAGAREKMNKSPSPKIYAPNSQIKLTKGLKKNAAIQVLLIIDCSKVVMTNHTIIFLF